MDGAGATITPSDGGVDDTFGFSVAISGNYIVVGAPQNNIGAVTDQGRRIRLLQQWRFVV